MATIQRTIRDDGICVLTFDRDGSSANIFDRATLDELSAHLDAIEADPALKGVVLVSAKRAIFIAGLDLKSIGEQASPIQVREIIELGQRSFNRLAALRIPTVAAIHGAAVGGGYEIALACDYRIASPDRATKIGLPETKIGLLPAWGGSTRLPRLIGLPAALDIILGGKTVASRQALKKGMVDDVAPAENLLALAIKKIRLGKPHRSDHWLTNNTLAVALISRRVLPDLRKRTHGHYPAVMRAFEVVTHGVGRPVPESLALERQGILELMDGEACRNLLRIFFLQERAKKMSVSAVETKPVRRTAVIGAGVMGAGIAQWLSARGLPVILRDINAEQVARGMAAIAKTYRDGVKRHSLSKIEARDGMDRVYPAPEEVSLRNVDLVVEAAVENLELKKKIFARLDALAGDGTILATNTSALPVSELAATTRLPERVLGLHFFNPVHRMQLVEIVAARQTSPDVLQRAVKLTQQIGKLPVVVKDSPGFLVNRILMPYLIEAGNLFEHGATVEALDDAMLNFGMPMGPMRLIDEVGVDVSLHVAQTLAAHFGDRMKIPLALGRLMELKWLGRKSGRGFYVHEKGKERPNPGTDSLVQDRAMASVSAEELQERMVFLMVNEAARCLEEQVVTEPADVDFAMIMGTGFAPFRGGPLRYADGLGLDKVVGAMDNLVDRGAEYFQPCDLMKSMAAAGRKFYAD
ncbi:MAG TPA: 3-hydroxyacyl-CoA dehydrogenase NAD-binding domain-containing protein [Desulfuromonadaceae bacterium]|nr:3-hydroxyacyl-CoA dehydrogenase NAD-binding domain-containing protein [Desulfuromonadaceae bacterium]